MVKFISIDKYYIKLNLKYFIHLVIYNTTIASLKIIPIYVIDNVYYHFTYVFYMQISLPGRRLDAWEPQQLPRSSL